MLYFKLDEQEAKYVANKDPVKIRGLDRNFKRSDAKPAADVSAYDPNLAYVPYKGTTIYRKTLAENYLKMIPREFADRPFRLDRASISILKQMLLEQNLHSDSSSSEQEDNKGDTVRNSYEVTHKANKISFQFMPKQESNTDFEDKREDAVATKLEILERDNS